MKYLLTISALLHCIVTCAQLPTVEWAVMNEVNNDDIGLAIDADGQSVYITGFIRGHVNLDPADQDLIPPYNPYWLFGDANRGDANVFVQKLNSQGNMVWGAFFGGTQDDEGRGIVVDAAGNVYVTGYFQGQAHFDAHIMTGPAVVTGSGKKDIFILKLSPSGALIWAKAIGGAEDDIGEALTLDSEGNVLVTGRFGGTVDLDPGAETSLKTSSGGSDIFVLKLDADGQFMWAQAFGGSGADAGRSIAVDAMDNTYITGHFMETVDFGTSTPIELSSAGASDIFIGKLDSQGEMAWAGRMGGPADDEGRTVRISALGHVFVNGSFMQTADLDPAASTDIHASNGGRDIFVCRLDANGQLIWTTAAGGTDDDAAVGMDTDPDGNVLSIGYFQKVVDLDPGVGVTTYTSIGYRDIFWQKLSADGQLIWAAQVGESLGQLPQAVAIDGIGRSFSTGGFHQLYNGVDFDPSPNGVAELDVWSGPTLDPFMQCMDASGDFQWVNRVEGNCCFGRVNEIAVDVEGNLIAAGSFSVRIDFDPGPGEYFLDADPNSGQNTAYSMFIQKLDPSGQLIWVKILRCKRGDNSIEQLATDAAGNIYVEGQFQDSLDLNPGPDDHWVYDPSVSQSDLGDIFIVKLNPDGEFIWGAQLTGEVTDWNFSHAMAVEESQGVYLYARAPGLVDVDPGPSIQLVQNARFLLHLDPLGNFEWVSLIKDTSNSSGSIFIYNDGLEALADGTFRLVAYYLGDVDLDVGAGTHFLPVENAMCVARYSSSGSLLTAATLPFEGFVSIDLSGDLLFFDNLDETVDLDPGPGFIYLTDDGLGSVDRYLLKILGNGTFGWVRHFASSDSGNLSMDHVRTNGSEAIIAGGHVTNTIDVDPGTNDLILVATPYPGTTYNYDPAVTCYDSAGILRWAFRFGNGYNNAFNSDLLGGMVTKGDFVYAVGSQYFYGPIDFDPSEDTLVLRSHNNSQYFVKWRRHDLITTVPDLNTSDAEPLWVSPNPATDYVTVQWPFVKGAAELRLLNSKGQLLQSRALNEATRYVQITLTYPAGLYLLQLQTDKQTHNAKLIIR